MSRYTSATDADRQAMLDAIGVGSLEDLFAEIPSGVRLQRELDLDDGRAEREVYEELKAPSPPATATARPRRASSAPGCTTTTCRP